MIKKPVSMYNQFLKPLLDGECSSNKLFEKSGLKKNKDTLQIKKDLEKAVLITETKNKKEMNENFHSQAHIIELSEFGRKVTLFLKNLDEFDKHLGNYLYKVDKVLGRLAYDWKREISKRKLNLNL